MSEELGAGDLRTAFTLIAKSVDRLEGKLDHVIASVAEVKEEQVAQGLIGEQTLQQATRTNGRVDRAEEWQRLHDRTHSADEKLEASALGFDAGRQSVRDGDRALVKRLVGLALHPRTLQVVGFAVLAVVGWLRL